MTAAMICKSVWLAGRAGVAGRGAEFGLAGVAQEQAGQWPQHLAQLAQLAHLAVYAGADLPEAGAACVQTRAKASHRAQIILANFIKPSSYYTTQFKITLQKVLSIGIAPRCAALRMLGATLALLAYGAVAGPPFITDDPEPVDYRHWEVYLASMHFQSADGWTGTAPHVEVNYGAISNLQLHAILPLSYSAPREGGLEYGYGDTELGFKYRFVQESEKMPQIGIFPLFEVPSGDAQRGLGSGHLQTFLPVWAQESWGNWTAYGGPGYWINPGAGNRNWEYAGALLQNQVRTNFLLGAELYHGTSPGPGQPANTAFNIGTVYDFNENEHLLFSAGRSIHGPIRFQTYIALQFTFGPEAK